MKRRVVITGTGAITPLGVGAATLLEAWSAGRCGIEDGLGRCADFKPAEFLGRKEMRRTDRFTQLAIAACDEALGEAGWGDEAPCRPEEVGCVIGTGIGGITTIEHQIAVHKEQGPRSVSPLGVPMMMSNAAPGVLAMRRGFRGPNFGVVSACAAGAHAIGTAFRMIQAGDARAVVTGGAESALTDMTAASFAAMGATSPTGVSRPFDARRDGFVLGEGSGALVLEDAELAHDRGARVLGELLGYAATADAFHLTAPEPEGAGAARAIKMALADASVAPDAIAYVNAHGTSTPLNDRAETMALKLALGPAAARVPVSSTKSATGHLLGASGAVEAVATVAALRAGIAPPTLAYEEPDEGLDLDYVPGRPRPLAPAGTSGHARLVAISNSFGFGGHNAVLVVGAAA
ncbi:MAG: 3-oxoacyl-[acyl-carrier-protein] synthase [Thermoleophilaceae bacterium]|nr:3-oxoacyl-[acyl-carrier-protein] synthase [Thermoleophilaceae bacterium]